MYRVNKGRKGRGTMHCMTANRPVLSSAMEYAHILVVY